MQGLEFLYLAMFVVGFAGSAIAVWLRRAPPQIDRQLDPLPSSLSLRSESRNAPFASASRLTPLEPTPAVNLGPFEEAPIAQLLFATRKSSGDRECPHCKRRFGETTVLCPFDATPLKSMGLRHKRTTRPGLTGARRPTCASCGRRYESAAKYCYHDGAPLSADSPAEVPLVRVCRACGFESTEVNGRCSCDNPDLIEIDPSRSSIQMPTIPMMHCRRCDHVAEPGTTHCPDDRELLYPVMNISLNALPPTGIGPRRKVCEKCGRRFSSSARYCAYDGTTLKHLN